jgi:hypothetical protein
MSKDKHHAKLRFENEHVENEGRFTLHFNTYLETQEGFLWLFFNFNVETA